jgi:hypothetical protein
MQRKASLPLVVIHPRYTDIQIARYAHSSPEMRFGYPGFIELSTGKGLIFLV